MALEKNHFGEENIRKNVWKSISIGVIFLLFDISNY